MIRAVETMMHLMVLSWVAVLGKGAGCCQVLKPGRTLGCAHLLFSHMLCLVETVISDMLRCSVGSGKP